MRFSVPKSSLLSNMKSNFDEILHGGKLFGVLEGNVVLEAT